MGGVLRSVALLVDLAAVCVLLAYFVPMLAGVPFWQWVEDHSSVNATQWDDNFVSDVLFNNPVYHTVLGSILGMHLVACALFVVRINGELVVLGAQSVCVVLVFELVFMVVSWVGWNVLTSSYMNFDGSLTTGHYVGTALFVVGNVTYFLLMLVNLIQYSGPVRWTDAQRAVLAMSILSFAISCGCGLYFVQSVLGDKHDFGWIFEHSAFIFFYSANLFLLGLCELWANEELPSQDDGGARDPAACIRLDLCFRPVRGTRQSDKQTREALKSVA